MVGADDYIDLKEQYATGPVVVIVLRGYPGYQCPLCRRQVGALINRAKTLAKAAHKVILVYPGRDRPNWNAMPNNSSVRAPYPSRWCWFAIRI